MVGMKYIASVSFGKDSLAMLLRLIEEDFPLDTVVFYDTGMEFDAIYNIVEKIQPILLKNGIEFVRLTPSDPFLYSMLERPIKYRNKPGFHYGYGWCGGPCRWGTRDKLTQIRKYKKSLNDEVIDYVGIAADEPDRFEKERSAGKRLPLVEWGMTEQDCLEYCYERGWNWNESIYGENVDLYSILDRVSCWCCANKNQKELYNIYRFLPSYWEKLKELQSKIDRPMKKYSKNGIPYGNLFDLERYFHKIR